jgi:hypothetical protein
MHFMLLQMHPRCIPSRDLDHSCNRLQNADAFHVAAEVSTLHPFPVIWILQQTADAFYVAADSSTLNPLPVIWITDAATIRSWSRPMLISIP